MKPQFWQDKWHQPKRGWSQARVNSRLVKHWQALKLDAGAAVLVPLCGDSVDIDWLIASGFRVTGSELVEDGLLQWFRRHELDPQRESRTQGADDTKAASIVRLMPRVGESYVSLPADDRTAAVADKTTKQQQPVFLCGDFFDLQPADFDVPPRAVYDRAALIALPPEMRSAYAEQLGNLLERGAQILLITLNYAEHEMQGPPFSVSNEEVQDLYTSGFTIEKLAGSEGPDIVGNLAERGLSNAGESVFLMTRR